ncbi:crotonase/enoyl-CoA hydratase family protein [Cupriavidus oxalaticus]|jgi:enoyl-CoA hydratase/carnithine racemase|uniref:Enoyl-CoA hydratase n=1 Tax=Cupriavidus oxalaticus TaxID=96344 RepID=A0A375GBI0_9BURK|nr:crotonase/enoyl-CoA hydratase family protein [Cupriavidus oxalaticus]QEZ44645.1 enoyl-CoA hydratase [Cupriavidus oxalaticus]QRQ83990.1 crotonase/enoyl-CoA hydratase family protein [Cupriavidus oxalaticus]QRQ91921.1 crotonase/enoyl-CoA hydratase family protein [Cupriavidus oxalaticus]WQD86512.1 crotonase/enoyl-CoA hydratase family protein [Cupriavidus oxalaticus]SPC17609.1 Enoyl-CoA hydratase [Cupriavidus oxalaticus]
MTQATPSFETLRYAVEDGVATITLHRPDQLNAFTAQMMQDLIAAFDATDADDNVRAVIVTGAGRAFCAGADLSGGGSTFDFEKRYGASPDTAHRDGGGRVSLRIFRSLKPVIAAVNGAAVGVGVTMQLPMDIRLASTDARFGFVFARRGITPEAASSWFLSRVVGVSTALEWCYTGRVFSAQEAHERGLVRSLHAPEDLLPAAQAIAREIADNAAPVSVAISRQLIWRMAGASHPMEAHKLDSRAIQSRGRSADVKEGVSAFLEKRPAAFPDTVSHDLPDFFDWRGEPPFA